MFFIINYRVKFCLYWCGITAHTTSKMVVLASAKPIPKIKPLSVQHVTFELLSYCLSSESSFSLPSYFRILGL